MRVKSWNCSSVSRPCSICSYASSSGCWNVGTSQWPISDPMKAGITAPRGLPGGRSDTATRGSSPSQPQKKLRQKCSACPPRPVLRWTRSRSSHPPRGQRRYQSIFRQSDQPRIILGRQTGEPGCVDIAKIEALHALWPPLLPPGDHVPVESNTDGHPSLQQPHAELREPIDDATEKERLGHRLPCGGKLPGSVDVVGR